MIDALLILFQSLSKDAGLNTGFPAWGLFCPALPEGLHWGAAEEQS